MKYRLLALLPVLSLGGPACGWGQPDSAAWVAALEERGLRQATATLDLALTDACEIGEVRIIQASPPDFFYDPSVFDIRAYLSEWMGPFDLGTERTLVATGVPGEMEFEASEGRMIRLPGGPGELNYLRCAFKGENLAGAEVFRWKDSELVSREVIHTPLSEMPVSFDRIVLQLEDD